VGLEQKYITLIQVIYTKPSENGVKHGSGYLVKEQLVLTARHVVYGQGESISDSLPEIRIRFLKDNPKSYNASVVWENENVDVCLLKLDKPYQEPVLSWGKVLRENRNKVECEGCGFPNAAVENNNKPTFNSAGFKGYIDIDAFVSKNLLAIALEHGYAPANAVLCKGFSGAPVFAGNHLVGIVVSTSTGYEGERLTVCPIEKILNKTENKATFSQLIGINPENLIEVNPLNNLPLPYNPTKRNEIFLSYNDEDKIQVDSIKQFLQGKGFKSFSNKESLTLGITGLDGIKQALKKAQAVIVCFGKQGLEPLQEQELLLALSEQASDLNGQMGGETNGKPLTVIPLLLPGAETKLSRLKPLLNKPINLITGVENETELVRLENIIKTHADLLSLVEICPYKALNSFREEDGLLFFGREQLSHELLEKVANNNLVAVVGASGSGKSSVVKAGLFPLIRKIYPNWATITFTPGETPWFNLTKELLYLWDNKLIGRELFEKAKEYAKKLTELKPDKLFPELLLEDWCNEILLSLSPKNQLIIVLDQFEELFNPAIEKQSKEFIKNLLKIVSTQDSKVKVILTLRADFYGKIVGFNPELSNKVLQGQLNVPPMRLEELREAIEKPANNVGLKFQKDLVDKILSEVVGQEGSLPLLEFALTQLWENRQGNKLTKEKYDEIGGVEGAIDKHANTIFDKLSSDQQQIALNMLTRLVRVSSANEEGTDTRKKVKLSGLPDAKPIIDKFVSARLLVLNRDTIINEEIVEVAHEALIRKWDKLTDLLNKERLFLLWRQRLSLQLEEWENTQYNKDSLLKGRVLDQAKQWLKKKPSELSLKEKEFINRSETTLAKSKYLAKAVRRVLFIGVIGLVSYELWVRTDLYQINSIISETSPIISTSEEETIENYYKVLVISGRLNEAILSANKISDSTLKIKVSICIASQLAKIGKTKEASEQIRPLDNIPYYKQYACTSITKELIKLGKASEAKEFLDNALTVANKMDEPSLRSEAYIIIASQLTDIGMTAQAKDSLDKALTAADKMVQPKDDSRSIPIWPKNEAYMSIVSQLIKLGKINEASIVADKIIEAPSKNITKPYRKNRSYNLIAEESAKLDRFNDALAFVNKIEDLYLRSTTCMSIASQLMVSGKTIEANHFLDESLFFADNMPDIPSNKIFLYTSLASKFTSFGRPAESNIIVDKALLFFKKLDKVSFISSSTVDCFIKLDKTKEILLITDTINDLSLKATIYISIADGLAKLGKINEALVIIDKVPEPYSRFNAYKSIIKELVKVGKTDEALSFTNKIDKFFTDSAYRLIAEELTKLSKFDEALGIMYKIIDPTDKINSDTVDTYNFIAKHLAKSKLTQPKINYITSALKIIPKFTKHKNQLTILASIAIMQAKLGLFYQARIMAEQLAPDGRLTVYTTILREYTIKQKPSLGKFFEEEKDNISVLNID
jgi:tetratricopeptide (TPR) repeat protein